MRAYALKLFIPVAVVVIVLFVAASEESGTAFQSQIFVGAAPETPAATDEIAEPDVEVATTALITTALGPPAPTTTSSTTAAPARTPITSTIGLNLSEWHVLQVAIARSWAPDLQSAWRYNYVKERTVLREKQEKNSEQYRKYGNILSTVSVFNEDAGQYGDHHSYICGLTEEEAAALPRMADSYLVYKDVAIAAGCGLWIKPPELTELEEHLSAAQTICGKGSPPEGEKYWYDLSSENLEERLYQANAEELARFYADPDGIPLCSTDMFVSYLPLCRHETTINFFNYHKFPDRMADPVYKDPHYGAFTGSPYLSMNFWHDRATAENEFHDYCTRLLRHHGETYQRP